MSAECKDVALYDSSNVFTGPNCGSFTWNIHNKELIEKILTAQRRNKFQSEPFIMTKLRWKLVLYPNGISKSQEGDVMLVLVLLTYPTELQQLRINCSITCNKSMASDTDTYTLSKNGNYICWPSKSLSLSEWKWMNLNNLSITVSIKIHDIVLNIPSNLIQQQLMTQNKFNYKQHTKYIHDIDAKMMRLMKNAKTGNIKSMEITICSKWM